ncbi:uncharacterized protein [Rutidosis leptorrhynchoides]|uniref:uncharacterized protein n=1 Tax=Rutidosis leptorrhynchoides TaxID=125765 RepID=UPI003A98EE23
MCFEKVSGLKINMNKSHLYGIGIPNQRIVEMANYLGCNMGSFPFSYLGMPIGNNMSKKEAWNPVIEKFNKRLSDWKARTLSFGGRLPLLKSVLSSLPLYFFSLFRAPSSVIILLENLRRKFFWGGTGNDTKLSWVKWDTILLPYREGGLNIGSLKSKNWALLGKWWWRFRTENDSLWVKVIKSIYGRDGGLGSLDSNIVPRRVSVWKKIISIGNDMSKIGFDLQAHFVRNIGDGSGVLFWQDTWVGGCNLKSKFPRLFRLETNVLATVKDRMQVINNSRSFQWEWSREISGRLNGEQEQLILLLSSFSGIGSGTEGWCFSLNSSGIYTCKQVSGLLDSLLLSDNTTGTKTLRNNCYHKKLCKTASDVWLGIHKWWNLNVSTSHGLEWIRASGYGNMSSDKKRVWQAIVWTTCYIIWKNRNQKIFRNDSWAPPKLINEIQIKTFEWISNRSRLIGKDWHRWLLNPSNLGDPRRNNLDTG